MKEVVRQSTEYEYCWRCGKKDCHIGPMDMHHPMGRGREWLFVFEPICRECHNWIHMNEDKAMIAGWLQPEYRGKKFAT